MSKLNKYLPILLAVLIIVSAFQAVQLNTLRDKLEAGSFAVSKSPVSGGAAPSAVASSGGSPTISDLPTMVGGC